MKEIDPNVMIAEVLKQFLKPVYEGSKSIGVDAYEKLKVNLDICYSKYLERNYERYSKTKTLLYRDAPVRLNDIYVKTDLELEYKGEVKESEFIKEVEENKRVIVSGSAGTGKSTFCKSKFLELVDNPKGIFPVFIELRHLNNIKEKSIFDFIVDTMIDIDSSFSRNQLEYSMKLGKVMLILDGFDEINEKDRALREKEIIKLANKYHKILIVVSSRPDNRFNSWEEFYTYKVLPLDKSKAKNLIHKLNYDRRVKNKFINELDKTLFDKHHSFACNPLLLTMMLLTFEQIAEIPNKIHLFYEQAFSTLFHKHDSLKSLYKRKSCSGLAIDEFKKILSSFCIFSYTLKKYYFEEGEIEELLDKALISCELEGSSKDIFQDLIDNVCIIQRDGIGYTFTHRSFQEYFTALYLVNLASSNKFAVFDKLAFISGHDDVLFMVYDINQNLLEQEWIIPKMEEILANFTNVPNSREGKLIVLSKIFNDLRLFKKVGLPHSNVNLKSKNGKTYNLNVRATANKRALINDISNVMRFYNHEFFYKIRRSKEMRDKRKEVLEDLIRIDFIKNKVDKINVENLEALKLSTKNRIINSGVCDPHNDRINFIKETLNFLKDKHKKRDEDIIDFLLI